MKLGRVLREELTSFHPRLWLAQLASGLLPAHSGRRTRAALLRLGGLQIGQGTLILGTPALVGPGNPYRLLSIGRYCWLNMGIIFDLGAPVVIGDQVDIGHQVLFITTSHDVGDSERRGAAQMVAPITVEDGAWIGARAILMPGVTVGRGAVVGAGAMVNKDVAANSLVGGVPARPLKELASGDGRVTEDAGGR